MQPSDTDPDLLIQLDEICEEYESQFAGGDEPRIEDFIDRVAPQHGSALIRELVKLEVGLRGERGEQISVDAVVQRYAPYLPDGESREALRSTVQKALDATDPQLAPTLSHTSPMQGKRPAEQANTPLPDIPGFEIQSVLGRGGMGIVFKGVQTSLNRPVALKMTLDQLAATEEYLDRFGKEAEAYAALNDPHFVQIYEFGQHEGRPYMALEFVEGGSLEEFRAGEPQAVRFSAELVETLAYTMQSAHRAGLVHRDLKPHNVLLNSKGVPKITDFGLVKRENQETAMTEQGRVMGTASYMAPEQSRGEKVEAAADIHALGAILYCLLTGRPPFLASTVYDTILQVRHETPVAPSRLRPDVPTDLETICLKSLEKEPAKRYASAAELADDIRRFLDGRPILARPVSTLERGWRWAKRNPWLAGLGTSVAVLLLTVAVVSSVMSWLLAAETETAKRSEVKAHQARIAEQMQRERAVMLLNESLHLIRDNILNLDNELRDTAEQVDLRNRLIQLAMTRFDVLRNQLEGHPLAERTVGMLHQRFGDILLEAGRLREALEEYGRSHQMILAAVRGEPENPVHRRNLAVAFNKLAEAYWRLGESRKARGFYQRTLESYLRWNQMRPDWQPATMQVALQYGELGYKDLLLGDPATAHKNFEHARVAWRQVERELQMQNYGVLANLEMLLGRTFYHLDDDKEAEYLLGRSLQKRQNLVNDGLTDARARWLGVARLELADFHMQRHCDLVRAWDLYRQVLAEFQRLWDADQTSRDRRVDLAAVHYRVGSVLLVARQRGIELDGAEGETAEHHFQRSLELREGVAQIDLDDMQAKIEWALALARTGRAAQAEGLAQELIETSQNDPKLLFQSAAILALCSQAEEEELTERCRARALETLGQALEAGWKNRVALRDDPDLEPIREDPEFIELLERIPQPTAGHAPSDPAA